MKPFKEIIKSNQAWLCLDCGKCSSICPITLHLVEGFTSPRLLVETALTCGEEITLEDSLVWSCLTCRRCSEICPSEVDFTAFIKETRVLAFDQGRSGSCTHSGMIQGWMRLMGDPNLEQERVGWLEKDLQVDPKSDTIYFPGCLPYYDAAFGDLGFEGLEIARAAVKILNSLGIKPRLLENERCCGHDLYWQGDQETFQNLGSLNLEIIQDAGAKRIITTCPECAHTLREIYPEEIGHLGVDIYHLSQFLAQQDPSFTSGSVEGPGGQTVTYQDPCRLGRFSDVYQQPRDLISGLGLELVEMDHHHDSSICCGTSCWSSCGQVNKRIQTSRLEEASKTGAQLMITTCHKCQIHLRCAQNGPGQTEPSRLVIRDLTTLLAERI